MMLMLHVIQADLVSDLSPHLSSQPLNKRNYSLQYLNKPTHPRLDPCLCGNDFGELSFEEDRDCCAIFMFSSKVPDKVVMLRCPVFWSYKRSFICRRVRAGCISRGRHGCC